MVDVRMSMEEYLALLGGVSMDSMPSGILEDAPMPKKKKISAYTRRYKANFKKIENDYKLKSGKWAKNGFKRAVKEAHRMSEKK
jgi:hypothetical protein